MPADDLTRAITSPTDPPTGTDPPTSAADPDGTLVAASAPTAEPPDADPLPAPFEQFEPTGELGRGGMAVVYRSLDTRFMREVAVKVMTARLAESPAAVRRFLEEARVTGQLSHNTIPPVHHIGTLPDGRPYLAMKLIKGETLGDLLKARPDPTHDLIRFLGVFEQVCQGVGYAHSRGVIHRDLKPGNVMVGQFGDVQVMDWGLAKEVGRADDPLGADADDDPPGTVLREVRIEGEEYTRAGSILGTPTYMSPEQATGDAERIDRRADVFGLGAILCAVLTGSPPYRATSTAAAVSMAQGWETADALRRLGHCTAEPAVVELCKRCLAKNPADRPADGAAVAAALAEVRAAAAEEKSKGDLQRMAAFARAGEARKKRRVQLLLAGVVLTTAGLAAAGVWLFDRQARDRKADADRQTAEEAVRTRAADEVREKLAGRAAEAVGEATATLNGVKKVGDDLARWRAGLAAAETALDRAAAVLADHPDAGPGSKLSAARDRLTQSRRDLTLLATLEDIALRAVDLDFGPDRRPDVAGEYAAAFAAHGLPRTLPAAEFARRVSDHPAPEAVLAALLDWHHHAPAADRAALDPLVAAAARCSPPLAGWVASRGNRAGRSEVYRKLLAAPNELSGWVAERVLADEPDGDRGSLVRFAERVQAGRPAATLSARLAFVLAADGSAPERAARHAAALAAARPDSPAALTLAAQVVAWSDPTPALAHLDRAVRLDPDAPGPRAARIALLVRHRDFTAATADLDELARRHPGHPAVLLRTAALIDAGDHAAAVAETDRLAPLLAPTAAAAVRLGETRFALNQFAPAADAFARAADLAPDAVRPLLLLAECRRRLADLAPTPEAKAERSGEAEAALLKAAARDPADYRPHQHLAWFYRDTGQAKKAATAGREAARLSRHEAPDARLAEVVGLLADGKTDAADVAAEKLRADHPAERCGFVAVALVAESRGQLPAAIAAIRSGFQANHHSDADLWHHYGRLYAANGQPKESAKYYRDAVRLSPVSAGCRWSLANALLAAGDTAGAERERLKAVELCPAYKELKLTPPKK